MEPSPAFLNSEITSRSGIRKVSAKCWNSGGLNPWILMWGYFAGYAAKDRHTTGMPVLDDVHPASEFEPRPPPKVHRASDRSARTKAHNDLHLFRFDKTRRICSKHCRHSCN